MPPLTHRQELILRIGFLVACGLVYIWWACNIPIAPWGEPGDLLERSGPDENMRLEIIEWILAHGALPEGSEPELVTNSWGFSYGFTTYGSSLIALPFASIAAAAGGGYEAIALAARLTNVGLSLASLALFFLIAHRFFVSWSTRLLFVGLIALTPQYAYWSCYFNCEMLEVFSCALTALGLIRGVEHRWRYGDDVYLGIALGLNAMSYYFAYGVIIASIVVYYATVARLRSTTVMARRSAVASYVVHPLVVLGTALAVAGWFFVRNLVLHGDIFGITAMNACGEANALEELKPSNRFTPARSGVGPVELIFVGWPGSGNPWIVDIFHSFVGRFGMLDTAMLSRWEYLIYGVILVVGFCAGWIRLALTRPSTRDGQWFKGPIVAYLIITILVPFIIAVYYAYSVDYQAQGRYFATALPSIMFLLAFGCGGGRLGGAVAEKRPERPSVRARARRTTDDFVTAADSDDALALMRSSVVSFVLFIVWVLLFIWAFVAVIVPLGSAPLW